MPQSNLHAEPWSKTDMLLLAELWFQGVQPHNIAQKLGRSKSAIMTRAWRMQMPQQDETTNLVYKLRSCITCDRLFCSQGPHNSACDHCRKSPLRQTIFP
ncbi:MAG: hypothetical protein EBT20_08645 [Alphaproteobacteria bacterium]|nr:hypothetical protein [Alphaproteobacteria bacterium]